jgi:large subunit ribosomal protein L12
MEYTYAALLLHKVGKDINEANLKAVISATGVSVDEAKVKVMVASLSGVDIASKLANASVSTAPAVAAAPVVEEKKKEEPKQDSAAGLASLFG